MERVGFEQNGVILNCRVIIQHLSFVEKQKNRLHISINEMMTT